MYVGKIAYGAPEFLSLKVIACGAAKLRGNRPPSVLILNRQSSRGREDWLCFGQARTNPLAARPFGAHRKRIHSGKNAW